MIYKIKEKFWSLGDEFTIYDEFDNEVYKVYGKAFSWGDKLSFQDLEGNELAFIEQKLLSLKPCYQIIIDGEEFAQVIKQWTGFKKKFTLDVPGPNDYQIDGSFQEHEFIFTRGDQEVASFSKEMWSRTDS